MIQLDLSREEAAILVEALDCELADLSYEIANTDRLDFRNKLKQKKAVLQKTLASLH